MHDPETPPTGPPATYWVTWRCDFETVSPQEAAQLAYEQLTTYGTDAWPPVLEVHGPHGTTLVIDLHTTADDDQ
ncbi:hypothetical protein [Streptomyces sp. NPDC048442]|uniref:hypothetical protein n=1 Tax=Streptomyces sp. NPDC048442 TaxID=3154823 RepID=UPI003449951A